MATRVLSFSRIDNRVEGVSGETDEGHLEGAGRCRQLCLKLVEVLNQLLGDVS